MPYSQKALEKRLAVLKHLETNPGSYVRDIAKQFGLLPHQAQQALKWLRQQGLAYSVRNLSYPCAWFVTKSSVGVSGKFERR